MDRLARNLDDLRALVRALTGRGVRVQFMKEQLTFTGDDTAMATLLLPVMGAFAEFERSLIRERQREGIALARQRGAYRGRARALSAEQVAQLRQRVAEGVRRPPLLGLRGQPRDGLSVLACQPGGRTAGLTHAVANGQQADRRRGQQRVTRCCKRQPMKITMSLRGGVLACCGRQERA